MFCSRELERADGIGAKRERSTGHYAHRAPLVHRPGRRRPGHQRPQHMKARSWTSAFGSSYRIAVHCRIGELRQRDRRALRHCHYGPDRVKGRDFDHVKRVAFAQHQLLRIGQGRQTAMSDPFTHVVHMVYRGEWQLSKCSQNGAAVRAPCPRRWISTRITIVSS